MRIVRQRFAMRRDRRIAISAQPPPGSSGFPLLQQWPGEPLALMLEFASRFGSPGEESNCLSGRNHATFVKQLLAWVSCPWSGRLLFP